MKHLELFKQGFDSTLAEKVKAENYPYIGYDAISGQMAYTTIEKPMWNQVITYYAEEPISWDEGLSERILQYCKDEGIDLGYYLYQGVGITSEGESHVVNQYNFIKEDFSNGVGHYYFEANDPKILCMTHFGGPFGESIIDPMISDSIVWEQYEPINIFKEKTTPKTLVIPEGVESLEMIGFYLLSVKGYCEQIELPKSLKYINAKALAGQELLVNINIPNKVEYIGNGAFSNCPLLKSVTGGEGVTHIETSAFENSPELILPVQIGKVLIKTSDDFNFIGITQVYKNACDGNQNIINADLSSCKYIEEYAFNNCTNLQHVQFSNELETINKYAFSGCPIQTIEFPNSLKRIEQRAFGNNTAITNLTISENIEYIGQSALTMSSLEKITYRAKRMQDLDPRQYPWGTMPYLTTYTIGSNVEYLPKHLIRNQMKNLTSITYEGTIDQWNSLEKSDTWESSTYLKTIHCTDGDIQL